MKLRLSIRTATGALAAGLLTAACFEAPLTDQGSTEAPPTLHQGSEAPPRLPATELQEHYCHERAYHGDGPADGICHTMPVGPIYEDDPWGRWDCATMGNFICGPNEADLTADEIAEHESFNALRAQLKELDQWGMTSEQENLYRAEFVANSLNDPNRGQPGYLQAEDGSWVHERYWERAR